MTFVLSNQLRVSVGGFAIDRVAEVEVIEESSLAAGTFEMTVFAPAGLVASLMVPAGALPGGIPPSVSASIQFGQKATFSWNWGPTFIGVVDLLDLDAATGAVRVRGRDLTARLVGANVEENFINQTASDVVLKVAADAGLDADVQSTSTIVGQYYQIEHARSGLNTQNRYVNAWDLVCDLARAEGFECWVQGETLYFQPPGSQGVASYQIDVAAMRAGIVQPLSISDLHFHCNLALGSSAGVRVRSWNSRDRSSVDVTYPDTAAAAGAAAPPVVFVVPNLTNDAALARAVTLHAELSRHRLVITGAMPGDFQLSPRDQLLMSGTGAGFDGTYEVDMITRRMDARGYTQTFVARMG